MVADPVENQGIKALLCMWINMLMLYEIHAFATGAENVLGGENKPDPNDFNDNADYEVAMKDYNTMIEKLNKRYMCVQSLGCGNFTEVTGFLRQGSENY